VKFNRPSGLKSGVFSIFGLVAPSLIYLVVTPILVRILGDAQYGLLVLFLAIPAFLGNIDFGLGAGGVLGMGRAIEAGDVPKAVRLHRELITLFALLGICLAAALWLAAPRLVYLLGMLQAIEYGKALFLVHLAAVALILSILTASVSILPRAVEQFPQIAMIQVLGKVVLWLGTVTLACFGSGLSGIFLWVVSLELLVLTVYVVWNTRLLPALLWLPVGRFHEIGGLIGSSAYAFIGQLSASCIYHVDKFLIAYFLGPAAVAYYSVAVGMASKLLVLAAAMSSFVFPRAVSLSAAAATDALKELYLRASRLTLLTLTPILAPAVILAPVLLRLWLPGFAEQSAGPMQLLLAAYFLSALSVVPAYIYNGKGNFRVSAIYAAIGTLLNVALCLVLIPRLRMIGAALAAVLSMAQSAVFMGSLENSFGMGWFGGQGKLFGQLGLLALAQFSALSAMARWVHGWPSLAAAGLAGWGLFYALWFLIPMATTEDKAVCNRLLRSWT